MLRYITAFLIAALVSCTAFAGLKEGVAALEKNDYTNALREFRPLAERGDAAAQFELGRMYALGLGVGKDNKLSTDWYRKAAESGHVQAQFILGNTYFNGYGIPRDKKQGLDRKSVV